MLEESPPTITNQVLERIGLEKFEKDNVVEFDPDQFLNQLKTQDPICPRCMVPMKFGSVQTPEGGTWWEYYRCPSSRFYTKCYVTCGASEVSAYLKRVDEQTHPCYKTIDPARFRCLCSKSLVLVWGLSINQYGFGDSSWVFVDPLKELAVTLGTLEIEPVWVGLGVGGS